MKIHHHTKIRLLSSLVMSFLSVFCLSQNFHDTKGEIEVTNAGQLQFSLPLGLPPGVKNVSPKVNLVYTSESGNGIAGYGWSISGISAISRTARNIKNSGEVKGVQLNYSDYYSFGDQKLILKSGEYGKDGAEYATEKYSNVRIKSVGINNPAQPWQGPEYWEVTFEDGAQAWYGRNMDGRTSMDYNISEWRDSNGNQISYSYIQENNVARISAISWGGNKNLNTPHMNTIQFKYTDRTLKEESYAQGVRNYQSTILSEVKVVANSKQFRRYAMEYTGNGTDYQFVGKVTEYNANDEPANPVTFTYPAMANSSYAEYVAEPEPFNDVKLTGDFNGDSYLDFIMNDGTVKLGALNETFMKVPTGKIFAGNAKVVSSLLDETGHLYNGNGVVEYAGSKVFGYIFRNNAFVKVFEKSIPQIDPQFDASLNEGDLNGDGMPDLFIIPNDGVPYDFQTRYIVDLKNQAATVSVWLLEPGINENDYTEQKYMDVDGDGKVEVINVTGSRYTVFEFVRQSADQYVKKIRFSGYLLEARDPEFPVLFGDFNGDGKLDFSMPITDTAVGKLDDWRFYMGTEKGFIPYLKKEFLAYRKYQKEMTGNYAKYAKQFFFSVTDMNKDGKSDIVQVFSYNQINMFNTNWREFGYVVSAKMSNGSESGGMPNFTPTWSFVSPKYQIQDLLDLTLFAPLTNTLKSGNNYYNVFLFWKEYLKKIKGPTPVSEMARMSSITQGGVTTSVKYQEVIPENNNFYKRQKDELYPYYSLYRVDQAYAVSQLLQEGKKQDFRYRGLTGNLYGKRFIGYLQTARSNWYADGLENAKIWFGSELSPILDGAPVKEWSIRTNNEDKIFPADISENNTQLLSFGSVMYRTDKLLNGQVVTSIPPAYIDKIITATVPEVTRNKDFLAGTFIENITTYGGYYLPSETVTTTDYGYGVSRTKFEYQHNLAGVGKDYYVGRPTSKIEKVDAYGDSKSNVTLYTYDGNLLKSRKFFPKTDVGSALREDYSYDGFGNIVEKQTRSGIDGNSNTVKTKYDPQGRFVIKKTDNLGLETLIVYNDWGLVLTQTDSDGNTLANTYDVWGKLLGTTSSLGGITTYQYEKDNQYGTIVTRNDPDGGISKVFTNRLGQNYRVTEKAFGHGKYVSKDTQYDALGRKLQESEPYFDGQTGNEWNTFMYDDSVFPAKVESKSFTGKLLETTVSGLTTVVKETNPADYGRITTQTMDALGNVISSTDKGGTVQFSYNAAGQQVKAQYAENIVTTVYDDWGNKIRVEDSSTGVYEYEYQGFMGTLSKVISPKGEKGYDCNNLGQLVHQKESSTIDGGQTTTKDITFTYDVHGRLISRSGTSNDEVYTSTTAYDPQGRVISNVQEGPEASFFHRDIMRDNEGRIVSYQKTIQSSGGATEVKVENLYSPWNGELYQVKDKTSGKVLWELKESNEKGLVTRATLGEAEIINTYDAAGFLKTINHSSAMKPNIINLTYTFDAIRNELQKRTSSLNGIVEYFDYDNNNRLVNWTDPVTATKPANNRNVYDLKGRIMENNDVGTMSYDNPAKIYQPTAMTLNNDGMKNYDQDLVQSILYNENNDPVFLNGEKGDVAFRYGLTSMRQKMTYGGNFGPEENGKYTKLYSEEGDFEVVRNNADGKERHIIYIEGTPYDSNIVYLNNLDGTASGFRFLHKDYLGSILAISDEKGNRLEQRHFDAWGNLTHLQIGNGKIAVGKAVIANALEILGGLVIDRGYTGHEHLMEVGIIHMNGRLYDPLLRRFLNADENIQAPFNTQNYNRYGYVMNNPMMYNDPDGEWVWVALGAVAGAYFTGVKANGSWNPVQWNWGETWGKIVMGGVIGAYTGGLGVAVGGAAASVAAVWGINGGLLGGAIAGAAGGAAAGAVSGMGTSIMFGEDVGEGALMGGLYGAALGGAIGGVTGAVSQGISNVQAAKIGAPQGTILKGAPIQVGRTQWTLNNTARTATVGRIPGKIPPVEIGDIGFSTDQVIGHDIVNEQFIPIYEKGPEVIYKGKYYSSTPSNTTQSGDQLYEIADGVRRSKIAEQLGSKTVEVIDNAGNTFKVPIENLRSPMKSSIPNDIRYRNLFDLIQKQGQKFPIYVQPGNRGVPVSEIQLIP